MKNPKLLLVSLLLCAGAATFVLRADSDDSNSQGEQATPLFHRHYKEKHVRIGAGMSAPIRLPVVNRMVRIAITMTRDDGEIGFADLPSVYNINPGVEGFSMQVGSGYFTEFSNNAFIVSGGASGTFVVRAADDSGGRVHVAMWY